MAGAFMAGADFVPPKKQAHKPLIKFLGKRSLLREQKVRTTLIECCHRSTNT